MLSRYKLIVCALSASTSTVFLKHVHLDASLQQKPQVNWARSRCRMNRSNHSLTPVRRPLYVSLDVTGQTIRWHRFVDLCTSAWTWIWPMANSCPCFFYTHHFSSPLYSYTLVAPYILGSFSHSILSTVDPQISAARPFIGVPLLFWLLTSYGTVEGTARLRLSTWELVIFECGMVFVYQSTVTPLQHRTFSSCRVVNSTGVFQRAYDVLHFLRNR
jgi:hypothetical protein